MTETEALDFAPLVAAINAQPLSTYTGSLTTPPCAEGLQFFVTTQQLPLNVATYNKIKSVVGFNARYTQAAPGQENLLSVAAKNIQARAGIVAPPVAAPVATPIVESPAAKPTASKAPSKAPAAPAEKVESIPAPVAAPVASPPTSVSKYSRILRASSILTWYQGNVQVVGSQVTPELAKLIKEQTGIDVPVSARLRRAIRAFKA